MFKIVQAFYRAYALILARPVFRKLNFFLYNLGARGLGVLNYHDSAASGEASFLKQYLSDKADAVVFDVGANAGAYSLQVASINPRTNIFAFEPHPRTFRELVSNTKQCTFVRALNYAVGDEAGSVKLYDYVAQDGSPHASLYLAVIEDIHKAASIAHKVEVVTLDEFIEGNSFKRVDLLKIDVEGNEFNVLKGSRRAIHRGAIKAIHFEFNEMNVVARTFFKDFWDFLPQYKFYRMLPHGLLRIEEYRAFSCEIFAYQNIVALLTEDLAAR